MSLHNASTPPSTKTINTTALNVFRLFQWLHQAPEGLSLREINDNFQKAPNINKVFSEDTIGIYLNTLRQCGCNITRPTKQTGGRYQLHGHQFTPGHEAEITHWANNLAAWKHALMSELSAEVILSVDEVVSALLRQGGDTTTVATYFDGTRSIDYRPFKNIIQTVEAAILSDALVFCQYNSPCNGKEHLYIQPRELVYDNGGLYVEGFQFGGPRGERTRLRIDRFLDCQLTQHPDVAKALMKKQRNNSILAKVIFSSLPLDETAIDSSLNPINSEYDTSLYGAKWMAKQLNYSTTSAPTAAPQSTDPPPLPSSNEMLISHNNDGRCMATFYLEDSFLAVQSLLQCPVAVHVATPTTLRQQYTDELTQLAYCYQIDSPMPFGIPSTNHAPLSQSTAL